MIETEVQPETRTAPVADREAPEESHTRSERDLLVPLVDEQEAGRIYDSSIHRWATWGALAGALLLGGLGWALAGGALPVAGLGQWAASGTALATFTAAGLGAAAGGLTGALLALYQIPTRRPTLRGS